MIKTPKTTKLGTTLPFQSIDMQGRNNFPEGKNGIIYIHHEKRVIHCKNTGLPILRDRQYVIRTEPSNGRWRIDLVPTLGPTEAVYAVTTGDAFWKTPQAAAEALVKVLDYQAKNSVL